MAHRKQSRTDQWWHLIDVDPVRAAHTTDGRAYVIHDESAEPAAIGPHAIPGTFWAIYDQPAPCLLKIELRGGSPECVALHIESEAPIAGLRQFPLREMVAHAAFVVADRGEKPIPLRRGEKPSAALLRTITEKGTLKSRRGVPVADSILEAVAAEYRLAVSIGSRSPTQDVARARKLPRSTVAKWVMEARKRGFLGAAERGQAGEKEGKNGSSR